MADLDYSFAPAPHNMATDRDLSAEAFRLWSVIHLLKWNHIEPTPDALAQAMGAHKRSIMRWLNELEDRQWIAWNRHNPNPNRRILLRSNAGSPDALVLEHIKDILSSDNPSIEAIRDAMQSDPPDTTDPSNTPSVPRNGDPTITSDTPVTSDSPGTSDTFVTCDSPVTSARGVTCGDRRVTESDSPVTCGDSTITRSDSCVTSPSFSDRPDASKPDSSEGGGSGGSRSRHRKRSTTAPPNPPDEPPTETEVWMIEKGFANVTAHRWRNIPLHVMQAEVAVRRAWGQNQGAMADAWKIAVPGSATKSGNGNGAYAPIDVQKYTSGEYGDLFRLGSDMSGLDMGNLDESEAGR